MGLYEKSVTAQVFRLKAEVYKTSRKVKEIKGLRVPPKGGNKESRRFIRLWRIDAEIAEKGHFWMETTCRPSSTPMGVFPSRAAIVSRLSWR